MSTTENNREKFLSEYSILHAAAVGVCVIRSKEPFRALDAVRGWAMAHMSKSPFKVHSMINGWGSYDHSQPAKEPLRDQVRDPVQALALVDAHFGGTPFPNGCYVMLWPHFALPRSPVMVQMLAELVPSCAENVKRLALIVPPSFNLPPELRDSIPVLDFDLPSRGELLDGYTRVVEGISNASRRPSYSDEEVGTVINAVAGMTEIEAESAVARSTAQFRDRFPRVPLAEFVASIMKVKTETIRRSECLEVMPTSKMEEVGGMEALKEWVAVRKPAFSERALEAGVDRPKGALFVGPPGTGKSLLAKAVAWALGLPLIRFDLSKVYGALVGESEGKIREALKTLDAMAPCVVMIDEIDKAVSRGDGRDGGVAQRVLGTLLTYLQETTSGNFMVFTANRVQALPSELVRKGRLDEIFAVDIPSDDERVDILKIHLAKRKENFAEVFTPEMVEEFIVKSAGYVGAEIESAVKEAKLIAFNNNRAVEPLDIFAQFTNSKPLSEAFKEDFDAMKSWAENNARPASGIKARARTRATPGPITGRQRTRTMPPTGLDG